MTTSRQRQHNKKLLSVPIWHIDRNKKEKKTTKIGSPPSILLPPPPNIVSIIAIAFFVAFGVVGMDPSSAMTTTTSSIGASVLASSSSSSSSSCLLSDSSSSTTMGTTTQSITYSENQLRESLKPPTPDKPQIPFPSLPVPTEEDSQSSSSSPSLSSVGSKTKNNASPSSAMDAGIIQALISLDPSSASSQRPFGNDVLVIKVWTGQPGSPTSSSSSSSSSSVMLLGGAKIPVAKIGSSLPVRIQLGPQNAVPSSLSSTISESERTMMTMKERTNLWNKYTAGSDLWIQGGICHPITTTTIFDDNTDDSFASSSTFFWSTSSSAVSSICPVDTGSKVTWEGTSLSKWIAIPQQSTTQQSSSSSSSPSLGLRAPAAIVLKPVSTSNN